MRIEANMHRAKSDLSKLVASALAGDEVIITRAGKPVARLMPIRQPRVAGQGRGQFQLSENFDDPLPDDLLRAFSGTGDRDFLIDRSTAAPDFPSDGAGQAADRE